MAARFVYTPFADLATVQLGEPQPVFVAALDDAVLGYFSRQDPTDLVSVNIEDFSAIYPDLNPEFLNDVLGEQVVAGLGDLFERLPQSLPDVSDKTVADFEVEFDRLVADNELTFERDVDPASEKVRGARLAYLIQQDWLAANDLPEELRRLGSLPATRMVQRVWLTYNPETDVAVIDFGTGGETERVDLHDQVVATFKAEDPTAFSYVEITNLEWMLSERRDWLVRLLGEDETSTLAELRAGAEHANESLPVTAELTATPTLARRTVTTRLDARREAGLHNFVLVVKAKAEEAVERVVAGARRLGELGEVLTEGLVSDEPALMEVGEVQPKELRERFTWSYGSGNPVDLTVIKRGDRFRMEGLAPDHKGGRLDIYAWVKPAVARTLEFHGRYDPEERRVEIAVDVDPEDGWFGVTFATLPPRTQPPTGELLDHLEVEIAGP